MPRDISLIVYGRPAWTELVNPPLVCVNMPDIELGERSARFLIDRIEAKRTDYEQIVVSPQLTSGGSVGNGPRFTKTII